MRKAAVGFAILAVVVSAAAFAGYQQVFSTFAMYDDEGYVMLSLRYFLAGRPLYDETYSQYGPAYYFVHGVFHRVGGLAITHDVTRLKTLAQWLAAAALAMLFAFRTTRSPALSIVAFVVVFFHLDRLTQEPGHPQELCVLAVAACLVLTTFLRSGVRVGWVVFALGIFAGMAVMTKINVGVVLVLPAAFALLSAAPQTRVIQVMRWLTVVAALLCPGVLLIKHGLHPLAMLLPAIAVSSMLGVVLIARRTSTEPVVRMRHVMIFAASLAGTAAIWLAMAWMHGTSPSGLVNGLVLQHTRFGDTFFVPPPLLPLALPCALLAPLLAFLAARGNRIIVPAARAALVVLLVMSAAAHFFETPLEIQGGDDDRGLAGLLVSFAPCLLWVLLIPALGDSRRPTDGLETGALVARTFLCFIAGLLPLMAYPVPGTQMAVGSFPLLLAGIVALSDFLRLDLGRLKRAAVVRRLLVGSLIAVVLATLVFRGVHTYRQREAYTPLAMPGASRLRLPAEQVETLQWLVTTLSQNSDTFIFGENARNSLYFWALIDPPTSLNPTVWPFLLTAVEQECVIDALSQHDRAVVVRDTADWPLPDDAPLLDYISENFEPASRRGSFEVWFRRGSSRASSLPTR